jgi:hypothetical protein
MVQALTIVTSVRKVSSSNLDWITLCPDRGILWFYSGTVKNTGVVHQLDHCRFLSNHA